jgi:hypothetical protein
VNWLDAQALAGIGVMMLGFTYFYRLMDRSTDYTPNAGVLRVLFCLGLMFAGGSLIAMARYP